MNIFDILQCIYLTITKIKLLRILCCSLLLSSKKIAIESFSNVYD